MPIKISVLQMHSHKLNTVANKNTLLGLIDKAASETPDIIVLPEMWPTGFYPAQAAEFAAESAKWHLLLSDSARKYGCNIVGGSFVTERNGHIYNTCPCFNRQGQSVAEYDKMHLFSPAAENNYFAHGEKICVFELDGVSCGVAVCYDLRFPELIREIAAKGAKIIFLPAQWPRLRLDHWRILNQARATENQIFMVAANGVGKHTAGHSLIVSPWGNILTEGDDSEGIYTAEINLTEIADVREKINVWADRRIA